MTSLAISNISDGTVEVTALFFEENQDNVPFVGPSHEFSIAGGHTLNVGDVLGEWFPSLGNTKGFLVLFAASSGESDDARIAVTGRVFNNADPSATYGQAISSNLVGMVFGIGRSVLTGAQWDSRTRSNVGVVNLSGDPLDIVITTYDANGNQVGSVKRTVRSFSLAQWALNRLGLSSLSPGGRVDVMVDPDSITWDPCDPASFGFSGFPGAFMSYISRVDQATGDGEFAHGQIDWAEFSIDCGYEPGEECAKSAFAIR
jgi:hypothetical protein